MISITNSFNLKDYWNIYDENIILLYKRQQGQGEQLGHDLGNALLKFPSSYDTIGTKMPCCASRSTCSTMSVQQRDANATASVR